MSKLEKAYRAMIHAETLPEHSEAREKAMYAAKMMVYALAPIDQQRVMAMVKLEHAQRARRAEKLDKHSPA